MPRGVTLVEVLVVVALVGVLSVLGVPRVFRVQDRIEVARATSEVASFYHAARYGAIMRARMVRIEFGAETLRAVYEGVTDSTFLLRPGPRRHGVSLAASRPVIRVSPNGIGYGAANTTLVLRRGDAADTLTTSRLGRLKRW
jgi:prepilin-type N-terminal cleavage/methylation domain-containing protein